MPCHEATTFLHTQAMMESSCCLLLHSGGASEELSEEENGIVQRAQGAALQVPEDMLRKDQVLIQNLKVMVVLATGGKGWVQCYAMLTGMLQHLISQLWKAAYWKNTHKAKSYAYEKIKVILEEQE